MKSRLAFLVLLMTPSAFAATELACWNMFSPRGARPIMTADIKSGNRLQNVEFNFADKWFELYIINRTGDAGEHWDHKPTYTVSELNQPEGIQSPTLIETNVYKGNNEYLFDIGKYSFKSPYHNTDGTYGVRLVLPVDLSPDALKDFRIRIPSERSNAVVIVPPAYDTNQNGSNYLRMYCLSH